MPGFPAFATTDLSPPTIIAASELTSKVVLAGCRYWSEKAAAAGRSMPARSALDPILEIPGLCPQLVLMDVQRDPLDFRYRLVGTRLRSEHQADWTGTLMSEIPFQHAPSRVWTVHSRVAETGEPIIYRPGYHGPNKRLRLIEAVVLPLSEDGRKVDMQLLFLEFFQEG